MPLADMKAFFRFLEEANEKEFQKIEDLNALIKNCRTSRSDCKDKCIA